MAFDFGAFAGGVGQGISQGQEQRARYEALVQQQATKRAEAAYAQALAAANNPTPAAPSAPAAQPPAPTPQPQQPMQLPRPMGPPAGGPGTAAPLQQMAMPGATPMPGAGGPPPQGQPMAMQGPPKPAAPAGPAAAPPGPGGGAGPATDTGGMQSPGMFSPQDIQAAGQMWQSMSQQANDLIKAKVQMIVAQERASGKKISHDDMAAVLAVAHDELSKEDVNPLMKEIIAANVQLMRAQASLMGIGMKGQTALDVEGMRERGVEYSADQRRGGQEYAADRGAESRVTAAGIGAQSRENVAGTNLQGREYSADQSRAASDYRANIGLEGRETTADTAERNADVNNQGRVNAAVANATGKAPPLGKPIARTTRPAVRQTPGDSGSSIPPEAIKHLKENQNTTFANGQVWTLRGGKPVRVK